jgi:mannose-6-phosphate isomerase
MNRYITKGWGSEEIWANTDRYCGKYLHFKDNSQFSMHFHADKDETWIVQSGEFIVEIIDTADASSRLIKLFPGDVWRNTPLMPHKLRCLKAGTVIEVSSKDSPNDNYRVAPGDSQK